MTIFYIIYFPLLVSTVTSVKINKWSKIYHITILIYFWGIIVFFSLFFFGKEVIIFITMTLYIIIFNYRKQVTLKFFINITIWYFPTENILFKKKKPKCHAHTSISPKFSLFLLLSYKRMKAEKIVWLKYDGCLI